MFIHLDTAHKLKDYLFILHHNVFILNLVLILLDLKVQGDRCGGQSRFWTNLIDRYKIRARTKPPDDPCLTGFCSGYRTRSKVRDFHLKRLKNYTHSRQKTFTQKLHYEDCQLNHLRFKNNEMLWHWYAKCQISCWCNKKTKHLLKENIKRNWRWYWAFLSRPNWLFIDARCSERTNSY